MRTEKPTSAASAVARFRSQLVRVRRALASQPPAFRWSLVLGVPAVLVLLGYFAAPVPAGSEFLRAGKRFSSGDIIKITRALDGQRIDYHVDEQGRIEIASDRLEDAKAVLAKVPLGPRSLEDLGQEAMATSPWEGPGEKEQRQSKVREEILGAMIRNLDGIVSAYVTLNRPKARGGLRPGAGPGAHPTAFVWLETDGGREIRHQTVQSIQNIIVGSEPDLRRDAVTVFDQKGRHYLVAGDPKYSTISHTRAREEELDQRLLEEIDWVKGVRVTVQLVPVAAPAVAVAPTPTPAVATPTAPAAESAGSSVGVNTPLTLEPDSPANSGPPPIPASAPTPPPVAASSLPEPAGARTEVARVWVRVPRSYYLTKAGLNRDPSPDRLQPFVKQTETLIREAVEHVVPPELTPPGERPDVTIDIIPDDLPTSVPLRSQVATDVRRPLSWWIPAGLAGGCLMAALSALGVRALAWRRPAGRRVAAARPGRYRSDAASEPGPGPAERVRELIRLNPEAGASVLHRWIGQGESLG